MLMDLEWRPLRHDVAAFRSESDQVRQAKCKDRTDDSDPERMTVILQYKYPSTDLSSLQKMLARSPPFGKMQFFDFFPR